MSVVVDKQFLAFSMNVFKLIWSDKDINIVLSPLSIMITLGMILLGSREQTAEQILHTLGHSSAEGFSQMFLKMAKSILTGEGMELYHSNRVYVSSRATSLIPAYQTSLYEQYLGHAESVDFHRDPTLVCKRINSAVSKATNGKIKEIISVSDMTENVKIVICATTYFKALWEDPFASGMTTRVEFLTANGFRVPVDMMYSRRDVNYFESKKLRCQIVEIPYMGGEYVFTVVLPNLDYSLEIMLNSMTVEAFKEMVAQLEKTDKVEIYIPKFVMRKKYDLTKTLKKFGIKNLFEPNVANLTGMIVDAGIGVSNVLHETVIDVGEEGTEAAAVTAARVTKRSLQIGPIFRADRPFFFAIMPANRSFFMFAGAFNRPDDSRAEARRLEDEL